MKNELTIQGEKVSSIEELRDKFSLNEVCSYARDTQLKDWLVTIGEYETAERIDSLKKVEDSEAFSSKLMEALGFEKDEIEKVIGANQVMPKQTVEDASVSDSQQHPIVRKVNKIKKMVREIILEILSDDISGDEFKWDLYLKKDLGCTTTQLFSIQKRLIQACQVPGQIFESVDSKFDTDKTPFGIFYAVIENLFPERYTCRHMIPGVVENALDNSHFPLFLRAAAIYNGVLENSVNKAGELGQIQNLSDIAKQTATKVVASEFDAAVKKGESVADLQFGYHPEWLGTDRKPLGF